MQQLMPKEYNDAVEKFRSIQIEMQAAVEKQAQFEAQKNENSLVKAELDALKDGESVYKLMGTVLVRQDVSEAKSLVNGRLEFITKEL
jgi:prefoldin beta subunit